jgi:hypothetical protein
MEMLLETIKRIWKFPSIEKRNDMNLIERATVNSDKTFLSHTTPHQRTNSGKTSQTGPSTSSNKTSGGRT